MITHNRVKREIIESRTMYNAVWHKIDIGAGMTHWVKSSWPPLPFKRVGGLRGSMQLSTVIVG